MADIEDVFDVYWNAMLSLEYVDITRAMNAGERMNSREYFTEDMLVTSRRSPLPYMRAMIAYQLKMDWGFPQKDIGILLNKDHSTICGWIKKLRVILNGRPAGYESVLSIYSRFIKAIGPINKEDYSIVVMKLGDLKKLFKQKCEEGKITPEVASEIIYNIQHL